GSAEFLRPLRHVPAAFRFRIGEPAVAPCAVVLPRLERVILQERAHVVAELEVYRREIDIHPNSSEKRFEQPPNSSESSVLLLERYSRLGSRRCLATATRSRASAPRPLRGARRFSTLRCSASSARASRRRPSTTSSVRRRARSAAFITTSATKRAWR